MYYSFPPRLMGHCVHCGKEIYTFDDPKHEWLDHAAFVEMVDNNTCRIIGGYGSTTMDMCVAEFTDYDIFEKCVKTLNDGHLFNTYICDDCITKLLEEGKIAYSSEARIAPMSMLIKEEHPKGWELTGSIHPSLRRRDLYVPVHMDVFALKFNDGYKRIVEEMKKFEPFVLGKYSIEYDDKLKSVVIMDESDPLHVDCTIKKDEVLVVYDRDDWSVLSERQFNKRYRFAF